MRILLYIYLGTVTFVLAQKQDTIQALKEVVANSNSIIETGHVIDSLVRPNQNINNNITLSQLIENETSIYLKNYGNGMLSSIGYRGLSASHTALLWEGLPLNSSMNGQVDLNLFSSSSFSDVVMRKGGGAAVLGSGSVGGSILMSNDLKYTKDFNFLGEQSIGSYGLSNTLGRIVYSSHKISLQAVVQRYKVANNYEVPSINGRIKLDNSQVKSNNYMLNTGYKINRYNTLKLSYWNSYNNRQLPGTYYSPNSDQLQKDKSNRLSLSFQHKKNTTEHLLNLGYIDEEYSYFNTSESPVSKSYAKNYITKYQGIKRLPKNWMVQVLILGNFNSGESENFGTPSREDITFSTSVYKKVNSSLRFAGTFHKGFSSAYSIPFTFDFGLDYIPNSNHAIHANFTTNYRTPTINDLYWIPNGNPNLKPENGWMTDAGYQYKNDKKTIQLGTNFYYGRFEDWIQWQPNEQGFWQPLNLHEIETYGNETDILFRKKINELSFILKARYAYVISRNIKDKKQLIYVPKHKLLYSLTVDYKNFYLNYNQHYNSKRYVTSSNTESLEPYSLANITLGYNFNVMGIENQLSCSVKNLFNKEYQSIQSYYMPTRNYVINIKVQL